MVIVEELLNIKGNINRGWVTMLPLALVHGEEGCIDATPVQV